MNIIEQKHETTTDLRFEEKLEFLMARNFEMFIQDKTKIRRKLISHNLKYKEKTRFLSENELNKALGKEKINFSLIGESNRFGLSNASNHDKFHKTNQKTFNSYFTCDNMENLNSFIISENKLLNLNSITNYINLYTNKKSFKSNRIKNENNKIKNSSKTKSFKKDSSSENFKSVEMRKKTFLDLGSKLNDQVEIPKGIFVYPLQELIRIGDNDILDFIPLFKNFQEFDRIIEITKVFMDDYFAEIPRNLDPSEKIYNPEFIVMCFYKAAFDFLKLSYKRNPEFEILSNKFDDIANFLVTNLSLITEKKIPQIVDIIETFSNIIIDRKLKKESKAFNYSNYLNEKEKSLIQITKKSHIEFENQMEIDDYPQNSIKNHKSDNDFEFNFNGLIKDVKKNKNKKFPNIHTYRNNYCCICFTYFCSVHFVQEFIPKYFDEFSTQSKKFEKEFLSFNLRKINRLKNKYIDIFYSDKHDKENFNKINLPNKDHIIERNELARNSNSYLEEKYFCMIKKCKNANQPFDDLLFLIENQPEKNDFISLLDKFDKKDLYILFLVSDLFYNACLVNDLYLERKYACSDVQRFIDCLLLYRNSDRNKYLKTFSEYMQHSYNLSDEFIKRDIPKFCNKKGYYLITKSIPKAKDTGK